MILKLIFFLLLHIYFCTAQYQGNPRPGSAQGIPYQPSAQRPYVNAGNTNRVVDCRTSPSSPDLKQPVDYQKSVPQDVGLVPQSLRDESQLKPQSDPVYRNDPKKTLYVYDQSDETDGLGNKRLPEQNDNQAFNKDSNKSDEDARRREKIEPPSESESTELGKIVGKCLSNKLKLAKERGLKKYSQLDSDEFLNTRRKNSNDSSVDEDTALEDLERNYNPNPVVEEKIADPAQAVGVRRLTNPNPNLLLMNNKKVCYACTSTNNPNCWVPNRLTTVKYCKKGNDACLTKTYTTERGLVVIRDCGSSCANKGFGFEPEYKSCSICHKNLCNDTNGASIPYSINSLGLIIGLALISYLKQAVYS